jgi:hypothetical protein
MPSERLRPRAKANQSTGIAQRSRHDRFVNAFTNSSSWSVRQHSNAVQYRPEAAITLSP